VFTDKPITISGSNNSNLYYSIIL